MLKILCRGIYVVSDLNGKEIIGTFYEKQCQKTNQTEFRIEKLIKKRVINYMSNEKVTIIHLIVELMEKILLYKNELFSTLLS